jgi:hypothetical protein
VPVVLRSGRQGELGEDAGHVPLDRALVERKDLERKGVDRDRSERPSRADLKEVPLQKAPLVRIRADPGEQAA